MNSFTAPVALSTGNKEYLHQFPSGQLSSFAAFTKGTLNGETITSTGFSIPVSSIKIQGWLNGSLTDAQEGFSLDSLSSLYSFEKYSLAGAGIDLASPGFYLTSGAGLPGLINTESGFSVNRNQPGDTLLTKYAQDAYKDAGETFDATILSFKLLPDAGTKSILLDLVFASDEYIEFINSSFVDIAAIEVNGVNYGYLDGDLSKPLSIVPGATSDPRFINNDPYTQSGIIDGWQPVDPSNLLPIEFDGITKALKIAIPLDQILPNIDGSYDIRIAVSDTGDSILDSGLWVSNLQASEFSLGGILINQSVTASEQLIGEQAVPNNFIIGSTANGATVTGGVKKDIYEIDPNAQNITLSGTAGQFQGDIVVGFNQNVTISLTDVLAADQLGILPGSAIIFFDTNKDGKFSSNEPSLKLEGNFNLAGFSFANGQITYAATGTGGNLKLLSKADIINENQASPSFGDPSTSTQQRSSSSEALTLAGTSGDDLLIGGDGNDVIRGKQGNDDLRGGKGNDQLFGGLGNDILKGGQGSDTLRGGGGDDQLYGGQGQDSLLGGKGSDELYGGKGNDLLTGADSINLGAGEIDILTGGQGVDTFVLGVGNKDFYSSGGNTDYGLITDFAQGDKIALGGKASDYTIIETDSIDVPGGIGIYKGSDLLAIIQGDPSLISGISLSSANIFVFEN